LKFFTDPFINNLHWPSKIWGMVANESPREFSIPAEIRQIVPASERVLALLNDEKDYDFIMAIQEALSNAIVHGCKGDASKSVRCSAEQDGQNMLVTISDPGPGFDFANPPDPTVGENVTEFNGRGLLMIRNIVDEVSFENGSATIRMRKSRPVLQTVSSSGR
jgi:anti-sigma regulatory factor (Ser/Thr protein kinase)